MTNTAARNFTTIDAAEMARNQIGEHIQGKIGQIREKRTAARGRLRKAISFLFSCGETNTYNLPADMQAKLYL